MKIGSHAIAVILGLTYLSWAHAAPPPDQPWQANAARAQEVAHLKQSNKVGKPVSEALQQAEKIEVVIAFDVPFRGARKDGALGEWKRRVKERRQGIFDAHQGNRLEVLREFQS